MHCSGAIRYIPTADANAVCISIIVFVAENDNDDDVTNKVKRLIPARITKHQQRKQ